MHPLIFFFHNQLTFSELCIILNIIIFFKIFSKQDETITSSSTTLKTTTTTSSSSITLTTTTSNEHIHESDDELEKLRLVDIGLIDNEWINDGENALNNEDDGDADHVPTLGDQDESDSSDSSDDDDDNNSTFTQSQQDRRIQEEEEEQEIERLLSNPDELKNRISCVLKKFVH